MARMISDETTPQISLGDASSKAVSDSHDEGHAQAGSDSGGEEAEVTATSTATTTTTTIKSDQDVDESMFLAEVPDDCAELDLTHCRLHDMGALGLKRFKHLERLGMRQNLFAKIVELEPLAPSLRELDLYDNRISKFDQLAGLKNLESLDLSFNKIKCIPEGVFKEMGSLKDLYFVANKIAVIEHLEGLQSLTNLELGSNRIREIQGLGCVPNLRQLWLGKNKITSLRGLERYENLQLLSIQSNRIVSLEGLEKLPNLEELYISHNGVLEIGHLEQCPKLRVLDACNNRISILSGIAHLTQLEELWLSNNQLKDWKAVEIQTRDMRSLETIYLEGNPLQREAGATYRVKVKLLLPQIRQIDATFAR